MRHLLTILAALFLCAPAFGQTVKALSYGTNGRFITGTNVLIFTNSISLAQGDFQISESGMIRWAGADRMEVETYTLYGPWNFDQPAAVRTNLGISASDAVTFSGLTNNGNIRINQTTPTDGLLFVYRTNNEPFLGLANLIASNNTTVSNETLFRVGVAEATNRSAQFGFRATNTNGNGVAVFSVFGFNALMQIGADASTNAVIFSGGGTNNEVMTLIRDGATEFARPLSFSTNASTRPATNAPANTTNVAAWVEMRIGTNSYRVPLYQ